MTSTVTAAFDWQEVRVGIPYGDHVDEIRQLRWNNPGFEIEIVSHGGGTGVRPRLDPAVPIKYVAPPAQGSAMTVRYRRVGDGLRSWLNGQPQEELAALDTPAGTAYLAERFGISVVTAARIVDDARGRYAVKGGGEA